jgi:SAM-dependent methyltransferase
MPSLLENWFLGPKAKRWLSRRRFVAVTGMLPPGRGRRALDVGCGWGYNLFLLGHRGYDPYGIDIVQDDFLAASMIAGANGREAGICCADMSGLPFPDGAFAAVTAVETFEHIFHPDRPAAVREAARVLGPGGVLVLSTPNYYSLVEAGKRVADRLPFLKRALPGMCYPVGDIGRADYHPYSYHRPSPAREIRSLLEGCGFEVTAVRRIIFVLKNVPDQLFPAARAVERVMEALPPLDLLASTLVMRAVRPL